MQNSGLVGGVLRRIDTVGLVVGLLYTRCLPLCLIACLPGCLAARCVFVIYVRSYNVSLSLWGAGREGGREGWVLCAGLEGPSAG